MAPRISPYTHTQHSKMHSMLSDCCVLVETAVMHISQQQYAVFKRERKRRCRLLVFDVGQTDGAFPLMVAEY